MSSLASLLTRDAIVPVEVIERALERQTLEGGELDTALLELNAAPENVLAAYRAALFRSEPVGRGELLRVEAAVIDCVTAKHARRFQVIPIAMQEGMLFVASFSPLSDDARNTLEAAVASPISVRITTEARIIASLERYYGVNTTERMRKLCAELDARSPGTLVHVDLDGPSKPSKPSKRMTPPPTMSAGGPRQLTQQRMSAVPGLPTDAAVHVTRVVELGSKTIQQYAKPAEHGKPAERDYDKDDPFDTRPARPSKLPPPANRESGRPPPGRETSRPAAPREASRPPAAVEPIRPAREDETGRTSIADVALVAALSNASDRAAVEEALLAHAAKHFEYTVLLEVRDKFLMGRAGKGLPRGFDVRSVESAMSRALQAVVLAGQSRVLDLFRDCPGDSLISLLDRPTCQPCAVLPIALGKRVVIAIYGDRGGKRFEAPDIAELAAALPSAGLALERILQERKFGALEARRSVPAHLGARTSTAPDGPARSSDHPTDPGVRPPRSDGQTVSGVGGSTRPNRDDPRQDLRQDLRQDMRQDISPELSEAALRSLTPPKSMAPGPAHEISESNEASPTMVLPRSPTPPRMPADGRDREGTGSDRPRSHERDSTRPERPSSLPPRDGAARLIAQPHKGAGSYAMRNADEAVVDVSRPSHQPDRSPRAPSTRPSDPRRSTHASEPKREARSNDPRRDGADRAMRPDVVTITPAVRDSLRPPAPPAESDALNIDLSGEADRLVERLAASTPGEEAPLVTGLLRLGQAGIAAIVRRFPGPAWAPRGQLHKRAIAGRDLGPLPRALWAFEDGFVEGLTELLEAQHADARLYAVVLAGDRVHPEFLWPLYRRLFDSEGTVRLIVAETLPLYRNVHGFEDILKSLRKRAIDDRETVQNRLAALEALSSLRDVGSIEPLADLSAHPDRQYSIPAQKALVAITGQDFDDSAKKWKAWYAKHEGFHRAQWLIESLLHSDERVRAIAGHELQKLTQVYYGFVASASKRDRERACDRYRAWWDAEGHAQFAR